MKKGFGILLALVLMALQTVVFALPQNQPRVEQLKTQLSIASGKEKIKVLAELIDALGTNAPRQVIQYGQQALTLLEKSPDPSLELGILNDICWNYHILGDYKKALETAARGIKIAEDLGLKDELSSFYNKIAVISWKSSDYDRALEYHRKAIEINKESFSERLAHSYNNIALVHMDMGEYEKALEYLLKALEINEKANEKLRITPALLNNIGWVYHNLKNYQKALEFFSKSLELKEEFGDKHGKANVFIDMGDTYRKLQDQQRALQCYQNARKLYDELEEKRGIANALDRIGSIYNNSNQHDSALNCYSQSLKINRELGDKQAIAGSILNTTRAYKHLDKYPEALEQAQNALAIAEEIKAKRLIGEILEEIADIYTEMGDFGKALTYFKKYKQHNESVFNEETGKKIAELQIKYETEKNEKEIALLKREKDISQLEISRQTNIRNFLIVVCVLILLLAIVTYYSYRSKVKINLKLKEEIAHHQETSAKLREMERERFKNKNLESIGVLAGGIAHDFNNLLSVIIGSISMAKEYTSDGEKEFSLLDRAEQASMQAANLAGKLLTFSKGDILIRKKLDLSQLLQKALDVEPPDHRYSIQLDISEPLMPIYGDERQIVQTFSNLIRNAVDAMPRGGIITIRAANTTINENNPFHLLSGQFVQLSIRDTGIGIPEENIGKIFDPYFSTKDKGVQKGVGMGLAVCYSIIRKHNGHITVKSTERKGTVVDIYLPAFIREKPIIKKEKEISLIPGKKGPTVNEKVKILFMDDDETIIAINQEMLHEMKFEVTCFKEGTQAVNAYKQAKTTNNPFGIIILDIINHIGMGGEEALLKIMESDPGVKSIAISGYLRDTDIENLKKRGFNQVLLKPYTPTQLQTVINKVLSS